MTTSYPQKMDPVADLLASEHPVAYRVSFARAMGGATVGLLLSQFYYWASRQPAERHGWFYMTQEDITTQTGLTRTETETARRKLREAGVLWEDKRGVPAKLWYKIDKDRLYAVLRVHSEGGNGNASQFAGIPQTGTGDTSNMVAENLQPGEAEPFTPDCGIPAIKNVAIPPSITKTSSVTTSEITTTGEPPTVVVEDVKNTSHGSPVVQQLIDQGISPDAAQHLITTFGEARCQRQVASLKYRKAENRAAVLRRSIEGDWAPDESQGRVEDSARRDQERREKQAAVSKAMKAQEEAQKAEKMRLEVVWESLTPEEQGKIMEQVWERAIESSPAPIRHRIELAAKSHEPLSDMVRAILERMRVDALRHFI